MVISKDEDARVEGMQWEKWVRCSPDDVPASCHTIIFAGSLPTR